MKKQFLLFCLIFGSVSASADTYYVSEPSSVGINRDDASAASELVRAAIGEMPDQSVVSDEKQAQYVLKAKLLKLGNSYVMTLEKYQNGKIKFSSQLKAAQLEELDTIANRLARAVVSETPASQDARVKDVTETERFAGNRRKEVVRRWYFGFGPHGTSNLGNTTNSFGYSIAYVWEMQGPAAVKLFLDGASRFSYFGIGGNYYLSDKDSSPVLQAQLGYGGAMREVDSDLTLDSVSGFGVGAGIGYQFFRTSAVNLEILLQYSTLLVKNQEGNPAEYGLRVGLYF